jgi:nicotinate-nucleotide pyrophosphorylase (carboxylating)
MNEQDFWNFIENAIHEDIKHGDHSTLACIPKDKEGKAELLIKQDGIIAGIDYVKRIFMKLDKNIDFEQFLNDGARVKNRDIAFIVSGSVHTILSAERLVLNIMQRMSGIATRTRKFADKIADLHTTILDTRKTTPGFRAFEKAAVKIGGGSNHRMGLYDMIMIKDNHIDYAGSIENAINKSLAYLKQNNLNLKIVVEARTIDCIKEILKTGHVDRILLDNMTVEQTLEAVNLINKRTETESSGGINFNNVRDYANCGVDFISLGTLTHKYKSLDMSLKAIS